MSLQVAAAQDAAYFITGFFSMVNVVILTRLMHDGYLNSYSLQFFEQRVLRGSLFWRFGHMKVERVAVPQSVQTQHKRYVVLQQTGV